MELVVVDHTRPAYDLPRSRARARCAAGSSRACWHPTIRSLTTQPSPACARWTATRSWQHEGHDPAGHRDSAGYATASSRSGRASRSCTGPTRPGSPPCTQPSRHRRSGWRPAAAERLRTRPSSSATAHGRLTATRARSSWSAATAAGAARLGLTTGSRSRSSTRPPAPTSPPTTARAPAPRCSPETLYGVGRDAYLRVGCVGQDELARIDGDASDVREAIERAAGQSQARVGQPGGGRPAARPAKARWPGSTETRPTRCPGPRPRSPTCAPSSAMRSRPAPRPSISPPSATRPPNRPPRSTAASAASSSRSRARAGAGCGRASRRPRPSSSSSSPRLRWRRRSRHALGGVPPRSRHRGCPRALRAPAAEPHSAGA